METISAESQSAETAIAQSRLLSMPQEILRAILDYVLSTPSTIRSMTRELDQRLNEDYLYYENDPFEDDGDSDMSITGVGSEEDDYDDIPRATVHLSNKYPDRFTEKWQRHLCTFLPMKCRHREPRWYKAYPEILASCRYFHEEGQQYLVKNKTVHIIYEFKDVNEAAVKGNILGMPNVNAALTKYPGLRLVEEWAIDIYIDLEDGNLHLELPTKDVMSKWVTTLNEDVSALREIRQLKSLTFKVIELGEYLPWQDAETINICNKVICNPFRVLRAKKCKVDTPVETLDKRIKRDITSSRPVFNMIDQRDAIFGLVDDIFEQTHNKIWHGSSWVSAATSRQEFYCLPHSPFATFDRFEELKGLLDELKTIWMLWDIDNLREPTLKVIELIKPYLLDARQIVLERQKYERGSKVPYIQRAMVNLSPGFWLDIWDQILTRWIDNTTVLERIYKQL